MMDDIDEFLNQAKPKAKPLDDIDTFLASKPTPKAPARKLRSGMSDDDIIRQMGYDPAVIKK